MSKALKESRGLFYQLYKLFSRKEIPAAEGIVIDVVIPVIEKDLRILPLCLEGLRKNVNHTIENIYIVSPAGEKVEQFCRDNKATFIDESTVIGYTANDINFITNNGRDRSGWIFQQLLKLSGKIGDNRYFLVIDADHVLLNSHTFIDRSLRTVFYRSSEYHIPYYLNIEMLTGYSDFGFTKFSYVTHKMMFDKMMLGELKERLERRSGKSWDKAIIESLNKDEVSPFSEFELYGNFVSDNKKVSLPWRTKSMSYSRIADYQTLKSRYGKRYLAVTFPDYYN